MVTTMEIAQEFGICRGSVNAILAPSSKAKYPKAMAIREYAKKMGYVSRKVCQVPKKEYHVRKPRKEHFYWNGNFHTKAEELKRMEELRAEGYSNTEIAKKIGRTLPTVYRGIGVQPEEMSKQNFMLGMKIYSQKVAARKQYVINAPIIAYNKALEEVKVAEEQLEKVKRDLTLKEAQARKNARKIVKSPSVVLSTAQIAG